MYCLCGCDSIVKAGNKFIIGHNARVLSKDDRIRMHSSRVIPIETRLCGCGCKRSFMCKNNSKQRFIHGHYIVIKNPMKVARFRKNLSKSLQGLRPWNKGVRGYTTSWMGQHHSKITKIKMSKNHWSKSQQERFFKIIVQDQLLKVGKHPNNFETDVFGLLESNFPKQFEYVGQGKILINNKSPDFIDERHKIVVLCNGFYWHLTKLGLSVTDRNKRNRERVESKPFLKSGYHVFVIWDDDFILRNIGA